MKNVIAALLILLISVSGFSQTNYYVNDGVQTGDVFTTTIGSNANPGTAAAPYATLDYAVTQAQPGDIIYVDAGTYITPNFTIDKAITIRGTNYQINPNDATNPLLPNLARNTESVISGSTITIGADNINFEGLTFDPGNKTALQLSNTSFGSLNFKRNKGVINSGFYISFAGTSVVTPNIPVASGFDFTYNRFEKAGTTGGTTFLLNYLNNVNISENSFVVTGANPRTQTTTAIGQSGVVNDFNFSGNIVDRANNNLFVVRLRNATINQNKFYNALNGTLIQSLIPESSNIEITGNTFERSLPLDRLTYLRDDGTGSGSSSLVKIEDNIFNNNASGNTGFYSSALQVQVNSTVLNPVVTVRGNKIFQSGDFSLISNNNVSGISFSGKLLNLLIENNELNFTGINLPGSPTSPSIPLINPGININTESEGTAGLPSNPVINILNNKISGFKQSIAFYDGSSTSPYFNSFVGYGNLPDNAIVNINNNSFTGDSISINNGTTSQNVNASCNWYESAFAGSVLSKVSLSTVHIYSWLINGSDNNLITGFQPISGSCDGYPGKLYVNDNSLTNDVFTTAMGNNSNPGTATAPFATLEYAVTQAQPGDTIYVDAGTYITPNFTIDKSITILGTNYQVSPNSAADPLVYNSSRNAESIINNSHITFAADNINIEGLSFNTPNDTNPAFELNSTAVNNNLCNNIKFAKNRLICPSSSLGQLRFFGKAGDPIVTSGYTIYDNRFENGRNAFNRLMNLSNITVSNNTFIGVSTTLSLIATYIQSKDNNITVENNVYQNWDAPIFSTVDISNLYLNNNTINNCQRCIQLQSTHAEPTTISITNNTVNQGSIVSYGSSVAIPIYVNRVAAINAVSANLIKVENNIITRDVTGQSISPAQLIFVSSTNNSASDPLSANHQITISKNKLTYTGNFSTITNTNSPLGIQLEGKPAAAKIDNNEISFSGTNVPNPAPGSILKPTGIIVNASAGIPSGAAININNNKVDGFSQSVAFYNTVAPVSYGGLTNGVVTNINNNSFTNDEISINNGTTSQTVDANCNWYGSITSQSVIVKVTPSTVNYSPWLTNGTDIDIPTVGFQPMEDVCNGSAPVIILNSSTDITCFGNNNGTINITVTGGSLPYTYAWTKDENPGFNSSAEDLTNLSAGTYNLIVTDVNGSTAILSEVIINEPVLLTAIAGGSNITCFGGSNGTASVTADGGTAPYSYLWSNSATTDAISNLSGGTYSITVTDANGCTATTQYEVTQPTLLTVAMTGTNASCNGSATATPSGGIAPYTYNWSNGATTQTISGVPHGTYSVTVTDANGCTATGSYTITGNSPINPTATVINVSCFGGSDGSITVTGAGGTAPHTYSINGSAFQSSNVFANLSAGTYVVGVKDATGCIDFVTKNVTQPTLMTVVVDSIRTACFGVSNGRIYITASGGSGGKTYSWTGPNGFTSTAQDPNNIAAGTYSVTVTDNKGCTAGLIYDLPSWNEFVISETITNVACKGELNGAIDITVNGGSGSGFMYNWTGPNGFTASTEDISGLKAGNYKITVTDINSGCTLQKTITVTQPSNNLTVATTKTNVIDCDNLGTITATASGGTAPYQYSLDDLIYQSSGSFTGLAGASYTVYARDINGCTISKAVSITDNGSDAYEGNNSKNNAKLITINSPINARIAPAATDIDWFKFTTGPSVVDHSLMFSHPSLANYSFDLYNNSSALINPASSSAGMKTYSSLVVNTTYYIKVTSTVSSLICYNLSVMTTAALRTSKATIAELNVSEIPQMRATVFPNPHQGSFGIKIESTQDGVATVEVLNSLGQRLAEKRLAVSKGGTSIANFTGMRYSILFYRVRIGNEIRSGKVIGPN